MCRFNLIMIKDVNAEELLKCEEYQRMYENLCGYMAYQKGYCNCGSFVGSLIDKKGMEYHDAIATCKKEKLDRLYQIRNIMNQPGYKERRESFLQMQRKLTDELNIFSEYINDFEMKQSDAIQEKFSGEDLNNQMGDLYKEIGAMHMALEAQPNYREKKEAYMNFLHENDLMNGSTCYYLTKEEQKEAFACSIPLSELLNLEEIRQSDNVEMIELEEESFVIDEVIAGIEKDTFTKNLDEFASYYKLFSGLLKYVQSFLFATIWSEPNELKNVKTVSIASLIIDDLAFLDYDEMICITK